MNINNPELPRERNEVEKLFDTLLFYRQSASLFVEQLRTIKELERLLPHDQAKFAEFLSDTIRLYETECEVVLDVAEHDPGPVPEEFRDDFYDKNTTSVQHLYAKRILILDYLQDIRTLWEDKRIEEIAVKLKETHSQDISQIYSAKKRIEKEFPLLENLIMTAIRDSPDTQKNESLKTSLEEMRSDFRKNGFEV